MLNESKLITEQEFAKELDKIRKVCEDEEYEVIASLSDNPEYRELQMASCAVLILEHYKRNVSFDIVDMFKKLEYVNAPIAAFCFSKEIYSFAEGLNHEIPIELIDEYTNLIYLGQTTKKGFSVDVAINAYLRDVILVPFSKNVVKDFCNNIRVQ